MSNTEFLTQMMKLMQVLNTNKDAEMRCRDACNHISDLCIDVINSDQSCQLIIDCGEA